MGKLNIFEICFANISGIFYSGNFVDGHVTIELIEPMTMRGIEIKFKGKSKVRWTESRGQSGSKTYSASEKYFEQKVLLYGIHSGQGSETTELPMGRHTFPFRFQLPLGLPSSYEDNIGHVRYSAKCKIDKPWKFDHETERLFTIISVLDLNTTPQYNEPVSDNKQKHLCCLCCKSGPITAQFRIDRQAYVPGEAIKLYADISNGTDRLMDQSYIDLRMKIQYHATSKTRTEKKELGRVSRPSIEAFREDQWTGELLVVPPTPPSFLVGCSIIDISYILQLNVDPSGPSLDLEVPLDIVIGTIPLMSVIEQFPPIAPLGPSPLQFGAAEGESFPAPPEFNIPNLPPPSYQECTTGRVDVGGEGDNSKKHTYSSQSFAPSYTYYNWGHTPSALPDTK